MNIRKSPVLLIFLLFLSCSGKKQMDLPAEIEAIENGLLRAVQVRGEQDQTYNLEERMEHYRVPGVSIAIVTEGRVRWAKGYGIANTETGTLVDTMTLFQAGSISKPVAALAALKLADEGKVDLDADVNTYLKNWKIPENKFTPDEKVTLRRLLTHTSGMTVHGFPGYKQSDHFPDLIDVLNGAGNTPAILVDTVPGSIWRYSGGGYTVMEKMVEDVSGESFEDHMTEKILEPLGMKNSTYQQPLPSFYHSRASAAYDDHGKLIEGYWHNYPEHAAAGLWTTPSDLARFCIEIQDILSGRKNGILTKNMTEEMLKSHLGNWGLGVSLTGEGSSLCFQHGGKNAGFTNFMIAFAHKGNAMIVMTNADNGGGLLREIARSVSAYYDWDIANPRFIKPVDLPQETLRWFTGVYHLGGDENYLVEIKMKNNRLMAVDRYRADSTELTAIGKSEFIVLENGDEVKFLEEGEKSGPGFVWNGRIDFIKMDD